MSSKEERRGTDRRRKWIVVFACFGMNTLMFGYIKCFGILFVEFVQAFNTSASMTSLVMGLTSASTSITSILVLNALMERLTIRKLALVGSVLASSGVILSSCATSIEFLLFSQSFLVGSAQGLTYGPGIVLVGKYFNRRRALGTSIALSGVSAGAVLVPLTLRYLLDTYNLNGALLVLGGLMINMLAFAGLYSEPDEETECVEVQNEDTESLNLEENVVKNSRAEDSLQDQVENVNPHSIASKFIPSDECASVKSKFPFLKDEWPKRVRDFTDITGSMVSLNSLVFYSAAKERYINHVDSLCQSTFSLKSVVSNDTDRKDKHQGQIKNGCFDLVRDPHFFIIWGFTFFGIIGTCCFPTFIPPLAKEKGLSNVHAAMLVSLFAALDLISRFGTGLLAELHFIQRRYMLIAMFLFLGVIYQFTEFYSDLTTMIIFVVMFGLTNGVYATLHPMLIIDFLGIDNFSKVFGFVQVFHGAAMSASYPVLGCIKDITETYTSCFYVLGATQFVAALFLLVEPFTRNQKTQ